LIGVFIFATSGVVTALERAFAHLVRHPATGSLRYAHELGLPDLRSWPIGRYHYLVFYVAGPDYLEVWRVLHGQRDIPSWLAGPDPTPF